MSICSDWDLENLSGFGGFEILDHWEGTDTNRKTLGRPTFAR